MADKEKVSDILRRIYEQLDKVTDEVIVRTGVTCRKGCAHCCQLLAIMTLSEALLVAEEVLKKPDWKGFVLRLREQALKVCYEGISESNYFDKGIQCAFLSEDKTCSIYAERPACCRYHVVISDPALCARDEVNRGTTTKMVDLRQLEARVWEFSAYVGEKTGLGTHVLAPIPVMVLYTMLAIMEPDEDRAYLVEATNGIPNPAEWMIKYVGTLTGGQGSQTSRIQLR